MDDDKVTAKADLWAGLWRSQRRDEMDDVLTGICADDRRRVVLCGQRMIAGMPLKVAKPSTGKETTDEQKNKQPRRPNAAGSSTEGVEGKVSVGTAAGAKKSGGKRSRADRKK